MNEKTLIERGFNKEKHKRALKEKNQNEITLTHPSNWMTEEEVEKHEIPRFKI